ncbi:hypothetical protein [Bermanella sp. R86510]|uniref:hypothetical protein n=1 Tax=unclassified Bermanella TaxID=2627862 RepID=UPI0037C5A043
MDWFAITSFVVGVLGTSIAIYQSAILRESKKRCAEIQYVLAGINNATLQKQQAWQNQIATLPKLESSQDWEMGRLYLKARDDFGEIAQLAVALEGTIDVDASAITQMMEKSKKIVKLNNELQEEGLKNPILANNQNAIPENQ